MACTLGFIPNEIAIKRNIAMFQKRQVAISTKRKIVMFQKRQVAISIKRNVSKTSRCNIYKT